MSTTNVVKFPSAQSRRRRAVAAPASTSTLESLEVVQTLEKLLAKARRGELIGLMHFTASSEGESRIEVAGTFADRLQSAMYTLVKGLDAVTEEISRSSG